MKERDRRCEGGRSETAQASLREYSLHPVFLQTSPRSKECLAPLNAVRAIRLQVGRQQPALHWFPFIKSDPGVSQYKEFINPSRRLGEMTAQDGGGEPESPTETWRPFDTNQKLVQLKCHAQTLQLCQRQNVWLGSLYSIVRLWPSSTCAKGRETQRSLSAITINKNLDFSQS